MPRVVVSRCLGLEACRYNGEMIVVDWLDELTTKAELIPICPELLAGLGVPREPINLYERGGNVIVVQEGTGMDVTEALTSASDEFLSKVGQVDAFILKSKSPSCGVGTAKKRSGDSSTLRSGVFAKKAMELFKESVFVDEKEVAEKGVDSLLGSL